MDFVVYWLVSRDFQCSGSMKDAVFLKHSRQKQKHRDSPERTSVSSKSNFVRKANSARLIILIGL